MGGDGCPSRGLRSVRGKCWWGRPSPVVPHTKRLVPPSHGSAQPVGRRCVVMPTSSLHFGYDPLDLGVASPCRPTEAKQLLLEVRRQRCRGRPTPPCPRCGVERTIRWGSFSGRQRWRCKGCGRTFSDLTATPMAYTKRLECWVAFGGCLITGSSVRRVAAQLGINKQTALRWRHRVGEAYGRLGRRALDGWVGLSVTYLPFSAKDWGRSAPRDPPELQVRFRAGPARRRRGRIAGRPGRGLTRVFFLAAGDGVSCDTSSGIGGSCNVGRASNEREGETGELPPSRDPSGNWQFAVGLGRYLFPAVRYLQYLLSDVLMEGATVIPAGLPSPMASGILGEAAKGAGLKLRDGSGKLWDPEHQRMPVGLQMANHLARIADSSESGRQLRAARDRMRTVRAVARRWRDWMCRFHGVASRKLPVYLGWYHALERVFSRTCSDHRTPTRGPGSAMILATVG